MASILKVDQLQSTDGTTKIQFANVPQGFVVQSKVISNSTKTAIPNAGEQIYFSDTFTKLRSDTNIVAIANVFGSIYSSGNCGVGIKFGDYWDFGSAYQYDGQWAPYQVTIIIGTGYWDARTYSIPAGSYTVAFGQKPVSGYTSERPFEYLNPNGAVDPRNPQLTSTITVYEIAP